MTNPSLFVASLRPPSTSRTADAPFRIRFLPTLHSLFLLGQPAQVGLCSAKIHIALIRICPTNYYYTAKGPTHLHSYPLPHQVGVRVGTGKRFALSPNHLLHYLISLFITAESEPATTQRWTFSGDRQLPVLPVRHPAMAAAVYRGLLFTHQHLN